MLKIEGIEKKFRDFHLQDIHLNVEKGDYFMLLGKSGSGKSLLLEIIAGLQRADSGKIMLNNKEITHLEIQKRNIGLLFQDFAIFPHLSVFQNIAYPLRSNKRNRKEIGEIVTNLAMEFEIAHLLRRKTNNLSGGEKQRLALARTLAMEPEILLLDEPLTSLDVQLRQGIRKLFRNINGKGKTIIHVTHDHEEAMLLANKVAVIHQGKIIQKGPVKDVFHRPVNEFVANFTGIKNFFRGVFIDDGQDELNKIQIKEGVIVKALRKPSGKETAVVIRCQDIILSKNKAETSAANNFRATVLEVFPSVVGFEVLLDIGVQLTALVSSEAIQKFKLAENNIIWVSFKASALKILD